MSEPRPGRVVGIPTHAQGTRWCESCGAVADVVLQDGSAWCELCDAAARVHTAVEVHVSRPPDPPIAMMVTSAERRWIDRMRRRA